MYPDYMRRGVLEQLERCVVLEHPSEHLGPSVPDLVLAQVQVDKGLVDFECVGDLHCP